MCLHVAEVTKPTPKDNEVLIKVQATPVNYGDLLARNFKNLPRRASSTCRCRCLPLMRLYFGLRKPRVNILGNEFAGVVEAVGAAVTRFKPGDQVYGYRGQSMGDLRRVCVHAEKRDRWPSSRPT